MNIAEIQQNIKLSIPIVDEKSFCPTDVCQLRNGDGKETWQNEKWNQTYTGHILQDCLHDAGIYEWENKETKEKFVYEGKFFVNNMEGYGLLSYPDGTTFEGLFLQNRRYGPGILTYVDGTQDVGLWEGNILVRLNQKLPDNSVPNLAETINGKTYLLNYKNLVPVQDKTNIFKDILVSLNANEELIENNEILSSKFCKNPNSLFFNQELFFDDYFHDDKDLYVNVVDSFDETGRPVVKQKLVNFLLAWNNGTVATSIMQHAFKHRNQENILTYNISNIFTAQRKLFREPGRLENVSFDFLKACCDNEHATIKKLICIYDIYPDISDVQGNNGIICAASHDKINNIQILIDFGANVDHLNDECLTALIICILRYIATKFDAKSWEIAFLPSNVNQPEITNEIPEWRPLSQFVNTQPPEKEPFLFDLSCVRVPLITKKGKGKKKKKEGKKLKSKASKGSTKSKKSKTTNTDDASQVEDPKVKMLKTISNTISVLLNCGANPNFGETPFPPLILSVFARSPSPLDQLLEFGADINIRTAHHLGSLTALHVLCSLRPVLELLDTAISLLTHGADPNARCGTNHWEVEKKVLLAGTETEDFGKNPLHLLCMRYDFVQDCQNILGALCVKLVNFGANLNDLYLGHSPLSLAIVRGNVKLVDQLLDTCRVNPNQGLGNNMGVPLTVLILKRYESILPVGICDKIYNSLKIHYANPFNLIPGLDINAIEFCNKENTIDQKEKKKKKASKKNKARAQIIQMLKNIARDVLNRYIQSQVVKLIYNFRIIQGYSDPIFKQMIKFLDVEIAAKILQVLIDNKMIEPDEELSNDFLYYIQKTRADPLSARTPRRSITTILNELHFFPEDKTTNKKCFKTIQPEVDPDEQKYVVCYECYEKKDKNLLLCPTCNLVNFCSQECNDKNLKNKNSLHTCASFYNSEKQRIALGGSALRTKDLSSRLQQNLIITLSKSSKSGGKDASGRRSGRSGSEDSEAEFNRKFGKFSREGTGKESKRRDKVSSRRGQDKDDIKNKKSKSTKSKHHDKGLSKLDTFGGTSRSTRDRDKSGGRRGKGIKMSPQYGNRSLSRGGRSDADNKWRGRSDRMKFSSFGDVAGRMGMTKYGRFGFGQTMKLGIMDGMELCGPINDSFLKMFAPYCILLDGELYYKFDNNGLFYRLTYSVV